MSLILINSGFVRQCLVCCLFSSFLKLITFHFNRNFGAYVLSGGPLKNDSKIKVNYLLKRLKQ